MINLTDQQSALLQRIKSAGPDGYVIRQGELGDVLTFGLYGLASITNGKQPPQRAIATARGNWRTAA